MTQNKTEQPEDAHKPVLALRVGFAGHRDLQAFDTTDLKKTLHNIMADTHELLYSNNRKWGYADSQPVCYFINSLADGADQLAATAAFESDLKCHLRAILPFDVDAYKNHFEFGADQAKQTFDRLAANPDATIINICGPHSSKEERRASYRSAADLLLENSDILIAVCDQERDEKAGGTKETVRLARQLDIPVIEIDPNEPIRPKLANCDDSDTPCNLDKTILLQQLSSILAPHYLEDYDPGRPAFLRHFSFSSKADSKEDRKREQLRRRERFFREPFTQTSGIKRLIAKGLFHIYRPFWRAIHNLGQICVPDIPESRQSPDNTDSKGTQQIEALRKPYTQERDRADKLSGFYMDCYRGSFVLNYLLGALAVLFALLSYFNYPLELFWLWGEIFVLLWIGANFAADRAWQWHERAIDYRFLAEHFRQMDNLAPLLRVTPLTRMPAHNRKGDPEVTWMNWYFRTVLRSTGLVGQSSANTNPIPRIFNLDRPYIECVHRSLHHDWLVEQQNYHHGLACRYQFIEKVVKLLSIGIFVATMAACFVHLAHIGVETEKLAPIHNWREGALLTILLAALPAFLAGLHGLAKHAELERLSERSEAMADHLAQIAERFSNLNLEGDRPSASIVGDKAVDISSMMLEELLEWRVIYLAHATELT